MATSSTCRGEEPDADHSDDSGCGCPVQQLDSSVSPGSRKNKRKSSEPKRRTDVLQMKRFRWESDGSESDCVYEEDRDRPSSGDSGCQLGSGTDSWPSPESPCKATLPIRQTVIQRGEIADNKNSEVKREDESAGTSAGNNESRFREPQEPSDDDHYSPQNIQSYRPRNYKSMSRQRRIEANARERTRVHTISAAFESLRRAVPAYADSQKLSKLAILRIASAYILSLACLNDMDYSRNQERPNFSECVDLCTKTIQAEGRTRRRGKE